MMQIVNNTQFGIISIYKRHGNQFRILSLTLPHIYLPAIKIFSE